MIFVKEQIPQVSGTETPAFRRAERVYWHGPTDRFSEVIIWTPKGEDSREVTCDGYGQIVESHFPEMAVSFAGNLDLKGRNCFWLGASSGYLTEYLLREKGAASVVEMEWDRQLYSVLHEIFGHDDGYITLFEDAYTYDFSKLTEGTLTKFDFAAIELSAEDSPNYRSVLEGVAGLLAPGGVISATQGHKDWDFPQTFKNLFPDAYFHTDCFGWRYATARV